MVLNRGMTVTGRTVGPDGRPVRDAWMWSRIIFLDKLRSPGTLGRRLRQCARRPVRR